MKRKYFVVAVMVLLFCFIMTGCQQKNPSSTIENSTIEHSNEESVSYMFELEDEKLAIQSVFPYSGINPDCNNLEGENIAAIQLHNISDEYLKEANIKLILEDGIVVKFYVEELPSRKSVMAFSTENISITGDINCKSANSSATFIGTASPETLGIDYKIDGIQVSLKNKSKKDISQLTVVCRDILDEEYFGGKAYYYTVDNFSDGERTTIDAMDCILGMVDLVRIEIK